MRRKPGGPGGTFLDGLKAGLGYTFIRSSCKNPIIQRQNCQCSVSDEIRSEKKRWQISRFFPAILQLNFRSFLLLCLKPFHKPLVSKPLLPCSEP